MKKTLTLLGLLFVLTGCGSYSDTGTPRIQAVDPDLSDNLDLNAIAVIFAQSENLEDFERRINDERRPVSNLDLNQDGQTDYLRVLSSYEQQIHVIVIQAVLERDVFQDVAIIDAGRDSSGQFNLQIMGAPYLYGPGYYISPVYPGVPVIYNYLWGPYYQPWTSPWHWGYYPAWYSPWSPWETHYYYTYVARYYPRNYTYRRSNSRDLSRASQLERKLSRRDFASSHPETDFSNRNRGLNNRNDLLINRGQLQRDQNTGNYSERQPSQATRGSSRQRNTPSQAPPVNRKPPAPGRTRDNRPPTTRTPPSDTSPARTNRTTRQQGRPPGTPPSGSL